MNHFLICSKSKQTLLQLFHEPLIYPFVPRYDFIKFQKLTKLRQKQQPKRGLLRVLLCLLIELGWNVITHVIQKEQLRFL